ncbi:MAG: transcription-repair coupling factor [Clostridiales bacterium]|nr:transcription-repair coupling factor [Clostridiales bacterium]
MNSFSALLSGNSEFKAILYDVSKNRVPMGVLGLSLTPKAHLIDALWDNTGRKALVIINDEASAVKICHDLCEMGMRGLMYPSRDWSFRSDENRSMEYDRKRLGVLGRIAEDDYDAVVCSVEAAMQYTIPKNVLTDKSVTLENGGEIELSKVTSALSAAGYVRTDMVEGEGQFAVRGSILDFFPPDSDNPVRVEFWGDSIDSMAYFDILSQRRGDNAEKIRITPAQEIIVDGDEEFADKISALATSLKGKKSDKIRESLFADADKLRSGVRLGSCDRYLNLVYGQPETIFDYCSDCMLFACESGNIKERAGSVIKLLNEDIKMMFEDGVLCKGLDNFSMKWNDVVSVYEKMGVVYLDNFARGTFDTPVKDLVTVNVRQSSPWEGSLNVLMDDLRPDIRAGYTAIVLAGTEKAAKSLCEDLNDDGFKCNYFSKAPTAFIENSVNIIPGSLSFGMDYPGDKLKIVTSGRYKSDGVRKASAGRKHKDISLGLHSIEELQRGDYVVHSLHGVGIFDGIVDMEVSGVHKDYIKIKYKGSDVLYVPVTQLDLVSKYIGPHEDDGKTVKINKLGGKDWERTKSRVRGAVKDMAKELLELYAKRRNTPGYAFSPDIDMQSDFERRFEFDETDDQLRCIHEIKEDMEKPYPMDRLLCGDVGFGKTEVALRAAFKCVADGKQCAILVPTTILALQHYRTILRRFEGFPISVDMLSRFRNAKQQEQIIKSLKNGSLDIIVGTHRLISKDVVFHDLGLVIIDEEQRFGVAQKEKFKSLFPSVDILTLSATPIPRTLNMAMTGIRDMSVIEEAPLDRSPVQTYVLEHEPAVIAEAMQKELRRGGQIYYLYNRIDDINEKAAEIHEYAPEANIAVAHGRMEEEELSEVWRQLLEGEIDILVCTTIIETGVDVPNVNTLIIENADRMGLAQLHQIRGRVGRSSRRAFAYLTFRQNKELSEIAQRRLSAIREYTEFGSGFKIAMKDLEIRGAGNILGAKQHGHLEAVGYDMYLQMLSEAVNEEQNKDVPHEEKKECIVDIRIDAHIPEKYIDSVPQRLAVYRKIADVRTKADESDVLDELIDRYGEPPAGVRGLITVSLIRNTAAKNDIYEISQNGNCLLLYCNSIDTETVKKLARPLRGRILVSAAAKPYISVKTLPGENPLTVLTKVMELLEK